MVKLVNRAKMTTATIGTGTLALGSAVDGFQSFAAAGVGSGDTVRYVIEEGDAWEIGTGSYNAAGPSMTRSPTESSGGGATISLTGEAIVFLTAAAEDLLTKVETTDPRLSDAREWTASTITQAEAETGTATTRRAFTAQRIRQAVLAWWADSADKSKLDGIAAGAQVNTVTSVVGKTGAVTLSAADVGAASASHSHTAATTSVAGFLSATDKSKLDGIAAGATANTGTVTSIAGGTGLSGSVSTSGSISLLAISAGSTSSGALFYNGTTRSAGRLYGGTTNPASTTRLNYDGNLHVNALTAVGDVTAFSDARLKTDIAPITDALAKVRALNGVTFARRDVTAGPTPLRRHAGLIAQEVEAVLPEVVEIDSAGLRSLAYGNMVALLIEAIKELAARIERLEAR
jgi:hypothetical protein